MTKLNLYENLICGLKTMKFQPNEYMRFYSILFMSIAIEGIF